MKPVYVQKVPSTSRATITSFQKLQNPVPIVNTKPLVIIRKVLSISNANTSKKPTQLESKKPIQVESKKSTPLASKKPIQLESKSHSQSTCLKFAKSVQTLQKEIATKNENLKINETHVDRTEEQDELESENGKNSDVIYKKLDGKYTCDICQMRFEQKNKLLRHIKGKHSFHRPFKCSSCSKSFKYKCDLKAHRLTHENVDSTLLHSCDKCDYRSKTKNNLKTHYIRKHTDDYKFSCEHCGKQFKMEWDLKFHIGIHGTSQHMCDICGKFYTSNYSLYKHQKVAHFNQYKFQCAICNKRLLTKENLDSHMEQHTKTYECKECGKSFASKRYLATHLTTHSSNKPYPCSVCGKNFRTSHMRNMHKFTHTTERPHICDLCGHSFKRRYNMIEHRKKHPDAHLSSPPIPLAGNSSKSVKS